MAHSCCLRRCFSRASFKAACRLRKARCSRWHPCSYDHMRAGRQQGVRHFPIHGESSACGRDGKRSEPAYCDEIPFGLTWACSAHSGYGPGAPHSGPQEMKVGCSVLSLLLKAARVRTRNAKRTTSSTAVTILCTAYPKGEGVGGVTWSGRIPKEPVRILSRISAACTPVKMPTLSMKA